MRTLIHIWRKEFIQIKRDKIMLRLLLVAPIIQVILFGYAATTDIKHLRLAVCDYDNSSLSRQFIGKFSRSGYFDLQCFVKSAKEIKELLDLGKCSLGIVIPPNFNARLKANKNTALQLLFDGSDSNAATVASGYVSQIVHKTSVDIIKSRFRAIMPSLLLKAEPQDAQLRIWYNPQLKSTYFMVPAIICLILTITTMVMSSAAIVRERELGTIEQLMVTPIKPYQLILGKTMPFVFIGLVDVVLVIVVGTLWFKVPIAGSILLLFALSALFILTTLGLGIFVSTISQTQQQAMLTSFFFMMPSMILSGFFFPISNMPKVVQYVTYLIPLRYFLVIVRGIFLKGVGLSILYNEVIALAIFGIAIFTLSTYRFRKRLE